MVELILEVKDLKAYYFTPLGIMNGADGVSFTIEKGEALGITGESGSGKSTVAWSIMRFLPYPGKIVNGEIFYKGQNIVKMDMEELRKIRWKEISMITQTAMNAFDPLMRIGDQITESILVNENVPEVIAEKRAKEIFEDVELTTSRFKSYPHELSGGMRQRALIAMALVCRPGLIIADEPTTALDVIVQAQILKLLAGLQHSMESLSILFITHDLSVITELCDKVLVMYGGKVMEYSDTRTIIKNPLHPYAEALVASFPNIGETEISFKFIPGNPPDTLLHHLKGCVFHPRCKYAKNICREEPPELVKVENNHFVACHLM